MGYRIEYGGEKASQRTDENVFGKGILFSIFAFSVFSFLVSRYWDEGWQILRSVYFPWHTSAVEAAAEGFVQSVRSGVDLSDAVMTFCAEIIFHGQG